ncbi:hypothetical protein HYPSUDRAFT_45842 [Hypholoma sublateritium FD-334 SS-4]|uniref:Pali-domain-containing protein n=1 Tax=Hypholoma sublateritium (strain FD-334 SS-4) TaxID=945553 RepID=A0A0D2NMC2_HYPSF|nr:hypothetical protein HYPSUDRAFT_45842 [Hypholoma sublateritium FD-334 SS-4]
MSRAFCIPGIVFLTCALVLSFLASLSLPFLPALDIVRVKFGTNSTGTASAGSLPVVSELRLGVWAPCEYDLQGARTCAEKHHGYEVQIGNPLDLTKIATIKPSWTRGLAVHPVATAVTFIAFLLSFSTHITITLVASFVAFLAALITLIAFAIDIALFALVKHAINGLDIGANTDTAPGFWLTFASLILLLLGGCTVCFGRRRERMSSATTNYPMKTTGRGRFWAKITGKSRA